MLSARMRLPMERRFTRQKLESMAPSALPKHLGEILLRISVAFEHTRAGVFSSALDFTRIAWYHEEEEELDLSSPSIYYSTYFQGGFPLLVRMHIAIPRLTHRIANVITTAKTDLLDPTGGY